MRGLLPAIVPALLLLAGCTAAPQANANLLSPKFVADLRFDGRMEVFIHSAFGEHYYDNLTLRVDNITLRSVNATRSIDEILDAEQFFLEIFAQRGASEFEFRGHLKLDPVKPTRVLISQFRRDSFQDPSTCALPCEWVISQAPEPVREER